MKPATACVKTHDLISSRAPAHGPACDQPHQPHLGLPVAIRDQRSIALSSRQVTVGLSQRLTKCSAKKNYQARNCPLGLSLIFNRKKKKKE